MSPYAPHQRAADEYRQSSALGRCPHADTGRAQAKEALAAAAHVSRRHTQGHRRPPKVVTEHVPLVHSVTRVVTKW